VTTDVDELQKMAEQIAEVEPEIVAGGNKQLAQIEYPFRENLRLSNFIRFHHPDGTHSDIAAPTFNPKRATRWRQDFILRYLGKRKNGEQWFFLKRQAPPPELPVRCFVQPGGTQCEKRLPNLPALYMHVTTRHGEESKLYADVLEAMKQKMQAQIDPETVKALGLAPEPTQQVEGDVAVASGQPEVFYCRHDGCPRFFDSEPGRNQHEYTCPQKSKKEAE